MGRAPREGMLRHALAVRAQLRAEWELVLEAELQAADDACRGYLVRADAPDRVTPRSLFLRTEAYAMRWATDELLDYWQTRPRTPWHRYEAARLDDDGWYLAGHYWGHALKLAESFG